MFVLAMFIGTFNCERIIACNLGQIVVNRSESEICTLLGILFAYIRICLLALLCDASSLLDFQAWNTKKVVIIYIVLRRNNVLHRAPETIVQEIVQMFRRVNF